MGWEWGRVGEYFVKQINNLLNWMLRDKLKNVSSVLFYDAISVAVNTLIYAPFGYIRVYRIDLKSDIDRL